MPWVSRWCVPTPSPRYSCDCHGPMGEREISPTTHARITSPLSLIPLCFRALPATTGCKPALHVRDAETLNLATHDPALELRIRLHVGDHAQIRAGAGEARSVWPLKPRLCPV